MKFKPLCVGKTELTRFQIEQLADNLILKVFMKKERFICTLKVSHSYLTYIKLQFSKLSINFINLAFRKHIHFIIRNLFKL